MKQIKLSSLLLFATLLFTTSLWAVAPSGLYEVEVPVADQADASRAVALVEALRQAVVKVSGKSAVAASPSLKEALKNPARYVEQYSYRASSSAAAQSPLLMAVIFDKARIDQLLLAAGVPKWSSAARPLTAVWLAVEQGGQRLLVGSGDRGIVKELLNQAAQRRGLPVRLPSLDAAEVARVSAEDAWGDSHDSIIQASQRYEAQAVLVGRLGQVAGGRWQVRWTLYQGGSSQRWTLSGDKVESLVTYGIDMATDTLAAGATPVAASAVTGNELHWVVSDVRDMSALRRVLDYLAALRGVTSVQTEQVTGDSVRLRITAQNSEAAAQQLSLDHRLIPLDAGALAHNTPAGLAQTGDQVYRLVP